MCQCSAMPPEDSRCDFCGKSLPVRSCGVVVLVVLALTACGGSPRYAGLSRPEAVKAAKTAVDAGLDPSKRPYFETSIWNVAAGHATDLQRRPVWLIGI